MRVFIWLLYGPLVAAGPVQQVISLCLRAPLRPGAKTLSLYIYYSDDCMNCLKEDYTWMGNTVQIGYSVY